VLTVISIGSASVVAHADIRKVVSEIAQQVPEAAGLSKPQATSKITQARCMPFHPTLLQIADL